MDKTTEDKQHGRLSLDAIESMRGDIRREIGNLKRDLELYDELDKLRGDLDELEMCYKSWVKMMNRHDAINDRLNEILAQLSLFPVV